MFTDFDIIMDRRPLSWQQNGTRTQTALLTCQWLMDNTPAFIKPNESLFNSLDLNAMDYSLWCILMAGLAAKQQDINDIDEVKATLIETWNGASMNTIQRAIASWFPCLRACIRNENDHFEHML